MRKRKLGGAAVAVVLVLVPVSAAAEGPLVSRIEAAVTASFLDADTSGRIDASGGAVGTELDFERDLGLEDTATAVGAEIGFRLGHRHQISLLYSDVDRQGSRTLEEGVVFGDLFFPAGLSAESSFDLRRAGVVYTFWPVLRERVGFGVSLGVIGTEIDAGLTGRLQIGSVELEQTERVSASAPLPLLGLELRGAPVERLRVRAFARVLSINDVSGWSGDVRDLAVTAEVRILPHLWLGGGYASYHLEVENEQDRIGRADLDLSGLQALAWLTF